MAATKPAIKEVPPANVCAHESVTPTYDPDEGRVPVCDGCGKVVSEDECGACMDDLECFAHFEPDE